MITVLVEPGSIATGVSLSLDPAEVHHLQVRRVSSGEDVRLLDGVGGIGMGILTLDRKAATVEVREAARVEPPPALRLAVGAGDRDRFGWLIEKSAELGVSDVFPLETERTVNVSSRIRSEHIEKLARRGLDAIKQSGSAWAPRVHASVSLDEFLADGRNLKLAAEQGTGAFPPIKPTDALDCLVGPEGGWTAREVATMDARGCRFVSLSFNTLRFETAAIAFAVLVRHQREG
ncbi:MAG: RsmE family RNA methyltransferase [Gemmatimonadota bacterium]